MANNDLNLNDFRAMMGKYNYGSLIVGAQGKLEKINNHAHFKLFRSIENPTNTQNMDVRKKFYDAIVASLREKNFNVENNKAVKRFLTAIENDLVGTGKNTMELSRSNDIARILDKLDAAMATWETTEDLLNDNSVNVDLYHRFLWTSRQPKAKKRLPVEKALLDSMHRMLQMTDGRLSVSSDIIEYVAKQLHISTTRATTYLKTRPEMILIEAERNISELLQELNDKDLVFMLREGGKQNAIKMLFARSVEKVYATTLFAQPYANLSSKELSVARFLKEMPPDKLWQDPAELMMLMATMDSLANGTAKTASVTLKGVPVRLEHADFSIKVRMGKGGIEIPGTPANFLSRLENLLMNDPARFSQKDIQSMRESEYCQCTNADEAQRRRNVFNMMAIGKATEYSLVQLQGLSKGKTQEIGDRILTDKSPISQAELKELIKNERMYSDDTLAVLHQFASLPDKLAKVKMTYAPPQQEDVGSLNRLFADLLCNEKVWMIDENQSLQGQRIRLTLLKHIDTVRTMLKNNISKNDLKKLNVFDDIGGADKFMAIKNELLDLLAKHDDLDALLKNSENNSLFANLEVNIDNQVTEAFADIQETFANLYNGLNSQNAVEKPLWQQSLSEIINNQRRNSSSVEGEFNMKLMSSYLSKAPIQEKRMMMASCLRLSTDETSKDLRIGSLLKGAGPFFHKLLQGIPDNDIPVGLKEAFKDMKGNLAPIPRDVVQAQLANLIEKSNGAITGIEVQKSLGSASVGQAFLCKITDKYNNEKLCVVKMLKPDVQNRLAREIPILEAIAAEVGKGMPNTLKGRLDTIKTELNFTVEADNIKKSSEIFNKAPEPGKEKHVCSVKLFEGIDPQMNIMVMELVKGTTVDGYVHDVIDAKMNEVKEKAHYAPGDGIHPASYRFDTLRDYLKYSREVGQIIKDTETRLGHLRQMAKDWFAEAVFGSGFMHCDPQAANIMFNQDYATFIDLGNALKLSKNEQIAMMTLVCASGAKDVSKALDAIKELLPQEAQQLFDRKRNDLTAVAEEIFAKGSFKDTTDRLFILCNLVGKHGIELPKSIFNFSQAFNRFKNTLDGLNTKLKEFKEFSQAFSFTEDLASCQNRNEPTDFAGLLFLGNSANFAPLEYLQNENTSQIKKLLSGKLKKNNQKDTFEQFQAGEPIPLQKRDKRNPLEVEINKCWTSIHRSQANNQDNPASPFNPGTCAMNSKNLVMNMLRLWRQDKNTNEQLTKEAKEVKISNRFLELIGGDSNFDFLESTEARRNFPLLLNISDEVDKLNLSKKQCEAMNGLLEKSLGNMADGLKNGTSPEIHDDDREAIKNLVKSIFEEKHGVEILGYDKDHHPEFANPDKSLKNSYASLSQTIRYFYEYVRNSLVSSYKAYQKKYVSENTYFIGGVELLRKFCNAEETTEFEQLLSKVHENANNEGACKAALRKFMVFTAKIQQHTAQDMQAQFNPGKEDFTMRGAVVEAINDKMAKKDLSNQFENAVLAAKVGIPLLRNTNDACQYDADWEERMEKVPTTLTVDEGNLFSPSADFSLKPSSPSVEYRTDSSHFMVHYTDVPMELSQIADDFSFSADITKSLLEKDQSWLDMEKNREKSKLFMEQLAFNLKNLQLYLMRNNQNDSRLYPDSNLQNMIQLRDNLKQSYQKLKKNVTQNPNDASIEKTLTEIQKNRKDLNRKLDKLMQEDQKMVYSWDDNQKKVVSQIRNEHGAGGTTTPKETFMTMLVRLNNVSSRQLLGRLYKHPKCQQLLAYAKNMQLPPLTDAELDSLVETKFNEHLKSIQMDDKQSQDTLKSITLPDGGKTTLYKSLRENFRDQLRLDFDRDMRRLMDTALVGIMGVNTIYPELAA